MRRTDVCRFAVAAAWLLLAGLLGACEQDNYDKGEGRYSLLQADFVVAHANGDKRIDYVLTDDGDSLRSDPLFRTSAITTADTLYRAILYYNKVQDADGRAAVEARSMSIVPVAVPVAVSDMDEMLTDPLKFESIWRARNGRYVNVSVVVMTGEAGSDELKQQLALVQDSVQTHANGLTTACCRLYHDQGGVPEYYSSQHYFSIPADSVKADSLRLSIVTYDGTVVKTLAVR